VSQATEADTLAVLCARLADERKAENIAILQIGELTSITDYFVIVTGRNSRQIRAIIRELEERMESLDHSILGIEGEPESGWVLMDLGEVVVHVFTTERRRFYDLELLWGDAPRLEWSEGTPLT